jgi:hypothetical protein
VNKARSAPEPAILRRAATTSRCPWPRPRASLRVVTALSPAAENSAPGVPHLHVQDGEGGKYLIVGGQQHDHRIECWVVAVVRGRRRGRVDRPGVALEAIHLRAQLVGQVGLIEGEHVHPAIVASVRTRRAPVR